MRPSGTHLYKRVCPSVCLSVHRSVRLSVRPSVCLLRKCKNRVSRLFLATVRSYTETNDQPTCFESLLYYLVISPVCLSICLSIYMSHDQYTKRQPGRIVARSGLLFSSSSVFPPHFLHFFSFFLQHRFSFNFFLIFISVWGICSPRLRTNAGCRR